MRQGFCPLFFDANGSTMPLEGSYFGSHAFLCLNGPSLALTAVEKLANLFTMTCNNGPTIMRSNANVMLDPASRFSLSQWLDPTIQKFVPMSHARMLLFDNRKIMMQQKWEWSKMHVGQCPNVVYFRRKDQFNPATFARERTICWGGKAKGQMVRSVMIAALRILVALGFREIYILGADFKMESANRYAYAMEPSESSAKGNTRAYGLLNELFTTLQPELVKIGVNVWNATPVSGLTAFRKISFDGAVERASAAIGTWRTEKVAGMYIDEEKKKLLPHAPVPAP